jgi:hypothetical protein
MAETSVAESEPLSPGADAFPQPEATGPYSEEEPSDSSESAEADPTPDTEAEPEAEPAESEPAEPAGIDSELLARAEVYGLSADDAKAHGTPESLRLTMLAMDRQAAAWGEKQLGLGEQQPPPADTARQEPPPKEQPPTKEQAAESLVEKFKLEINPDEWDADVAKALNGVNDHYYSLVNKQQSELKELRDALVNTHDYVQFITSQSQQAEAAQVEQELDTFFDSLGDEFGEVYGKGPIRQLSESAPQRAKRIEFVQKMRALEYADANTPNRRPMARKEMLGRVQAFLHPDILKQTARKEIESKVKARSQQSLERPSGKNGKAATRRERAIAYAEEHSKYLR